MKNQQTKIYPGSKQYMHTSDRNLMWEFLSQRNQRGNINLRNIVHSNRIATDQVRKQMKIDRDIEIREWNVSNDRGRQSYKEKPSSKNSTKFSLRTPRNQLETAAETDPEPIRQ